MLLVFIYLFIFLRNFEDLQILYGCGLFFQVDDCNIEGNWKLGAKDPNLNVMVRVEFV